MKDIIIKVEKVIVKILIIVSAIFLNVSGIAQAQTNISGYISTSGFELPKYGNFGFIGINSLLSFEGNVGDHASYLLAFEASNDFSSTSSFSIDFREAYFRYTAGIFDVYLGKQIVSWGLADGINPTDNINARYVGTRYATDLDSLKIGLNMLRCDIFPSDNLQIEVLLTPIFIPHSLPSMAFEEVVSPTLTLKMEDTGSLPSTRLENIQGGLRSLFYLDNLTFSLSYLYIFDRYPDIYSTIVTNTGSPPSLTITMQPEYNRLHVIGGDFETYIMNYDIRGETALIITKDTSGKDPYIKNSFVRGILEIEKNFFSDNLNIALGWVPQYVFNYVPVDNYAQSDQYVAEEIYKHNGQAYEFENGLFMHLRGKLMHETFEPEGTFIYDLKAHDFLLMPRFKYNVADGLNLITGMTVYGSTLAKNDPDREYGMFSNSSIIDNDTLYMELKLNF